MADPVGISVALSDGPLVAEPTWTRLDTTDNLISGYQIRRGRQDEFSRTGTGTATVTANDREGVFDPTLSPDFDSKQVALALHNPVADTWKTIFRGLVDDCQNVMDPSQLVSRVTLPLVDGLDYLAGHELRVGVNGDFFGLGVGNCTYAATPSDTVDVRIKQVLVESGWPSTGFVPDLASIFTGNVRLQETVYAPGTSALTVIDECADAEFPGFANRYVSKEGLFTFHGRLARFDPFGDSYGIQTWKVGDGAAIAGDANYAQLRGLSFSRPRSSLINSCLITPQGVAEADIPTMQVEDAGSISTYGVHSFSAENLRILNSALSGNNAKDECLLYSNFFVSTYNEPRTRVNQIVIRSLDPSDSRAATVWSLMCNVEISDIIHLNTTHPGGGGFDDDFFVEGISYDVQPLQPDFANVTLTLDVTPRTYYPADWDWTGA